MLMIRILIAAGLILGLLPSALAAELKRETREVGAFNAIEMRGAARVEVTAGQKESLTIEAKPEVLEDITTEVRDGKLIIDRKDHWWGANWRTDGPILITVTLPKLDSFELGGSADVTFKGLKGGASAFSINGTGNMKGAGTLDRLTINVNGTGNVDFSEITANDARVAVNGTVSVRVHPERSLSANINGVGSIVYDGNPQNISSAINGVGSVRQSRQ